jgi:hypothetical protein
MGGGRSRCWWSVVSQSVSHLLVRLRSADGPRNATTTRVQEQARRVSERERERSERGEKGVKRDPERASKRVNQRAATRKSYGTRRPEVNLKISKVLLDVRVRDE